MMRKIFINLARWLMIQSAKYVFRYIDTNKDGVISLAEITAIVKMFQGLLNESKKTKQSVKSSIKKQEIYEALERLDGKR